MGSESDRLTTGLAAVRIGGGLMPHHVDRLCRRGLVPHETCGKLRLILIADLPAVRAAAVEAGYLRADGATAPAVALA